MKNLERKSTIAQYAHVITTQGYPMCGRRKGEKQGAPPKQGALKKEDFVTGLSLMLTIYPNVQQDLIESYGLQRFATMSIAAKTFKEDPIYAALKLELEVFLNGFKNTYPDLKYTVAAEFCPESYDAGVVKPHFHVLLLRARFFLLQMPKVVKYQNTAVHTTRGVTDRRNAATAVNRGSYYCGVQKIVVLTCLAAGFRINTIQSTPIG